MFLASFWAFYILSCFLGNKRKKSPIPTYLKADLYKQSKPDNFQRKQRNSV